MYFQVLFCSRLKLKLNVIGKLVAGNSVSKAETTFVVGATGVCELYLLYRCVIVVGLPYPSVKSAELREKMDYLNANMVSVHILYCGV